MSLRTQLLAVVIGLAMLFGGASQAQAAKGVKKKQASAKEHHHHGKVVSVGSGQFTIHEHHKGKKKKAAKVHTHKFTISGSTKFFFVHKKMPPKATTSASLKVGEHVSVASHNGQADVVKIHAKPKKAAKKKPPKKKN